MILNYVIVFSLVVGSCFSTFSDSQNEIRKSSENRRVMEITQSIKPQIEIQEGTTYDFFATLSFMYGIEKWNTKEFAVIYWIKVRD